jgi:putative membrane protein
VKIKLNAEDKKRVTQAIEKAENKTSAQIAWKVRDRSSSYSDAAWIWAFIMLLLGLIAQMLLTTINGWSTSVAFPLVDVIICLGLGALIAKIPAGRRLVISNKRMERRVLERGRSSFFTGGVHLTTQHNGVLIYISLYEKMSFLITDRAVDIRGYSSSWYFAHDYKGPTWKDKTAFVETLIFYIDCLGEYLSQKYPKAAGDTSNEVPDEELPDDDGSDEGPSNPGDDPSEPDLPKNSTMD